MEDKIDNMKEIVVKDKGAWEIIEELKDLSINATIGLLSQESKLSSIGRILRSKNNQPFIERFWQEVSDLYEAGKIKTGFINSSEGIECLCLLIDYFDKHTITEVKFEILKKIYFVACQKEKIEEFEVLPSEYMKIAVSLEVGEILVLNASQKLALSGQAAHKDIVHNPHRWSLKIAELSGLGTKELVDIYASKLAVKLLLSAITKGGGLESNGENGRLTSLGIELCQFIEKPESFNCVKA